jgi:hypothetical protein
MRLTATRLAVAFSISVLVPASALAGSKPSPGGWLPCRATIPAVFDAPVVETSDLEWPAPASLRLEDPAGEANAAWLPSAAIGAGRNAIAPAATVRIGASSRPRPLVPLYVSYAALQGADLVTTARARGRGAVEANPLLGGLGNSSAGLLTVKAGVAVGTFYLAERLWRRNRVAAVALMAGLNGAYAVIVARNYALGRR